MSLLSKIEQFEASENTPFWSLKCLVIGTFGYLSILYILSEFYMKNRSKYSLLTVTRIHNIILFLWSCFMFFGVLYHLLPHIINKGFFNAIIVDNDNSVYKSIEFWYYSYYICKYYEMIDTIILVLKKKKLIFLHVFHHGIMPWSVYIAMIEHWTPSLYALVWNNLIHIFMYFYYFQASFKDNKENKKGAGSGNKPWWRQLLTTGQIIQFAGGIWTASLYWRYCFDFGDKSIFEYDYLFGPTKCTQNSNPWICVFQTILVSFFLLLFIGFYINAYSKKKSKQF